MRNPRFNDRTERKVHSASGGLTPTVDPRFHKEKARRMIRASAVSAVSVPEELEIPLTEALDKFEMNESLEKPERSDAHDIYL